MTADLLNNYLRQYLTGFKRHGPPGLFVRSGFIYKQFEMELTPDVKTEIRLFELERAQQRKEKEEWKVQKASAEVKMREKEKWRLDLIEASMAMSRVFAYGLSFSFPPPFLERRKIARENAIRRQSSVAIKERQAKAPN